MVLMSIGTVQADAGSDYKAGSAFARQIQGQGTSTLKTAKPEEMLPGYSARPPQAGYYGGVQAGSDGSLKHDGINDWQQNDAGKAVTESFMNKPKDVLSPDAPFIQAGRDVEARALDIVGKAGPECDAGEINRSEFKNYTCERDLQVEAFCERTANIVGDWQESTETRQFNLSSFQFSRKGKAIVFSVPAPASGVVIRASLRFDTERYLWNSRVNFMNTSFNLGWSRDINLTGAPGMVLSEGELITGDSCSGDGGCPGLIDNRIYELWLNGSSKMTLTIVMNVSARKWVPRVEWTENCPFSKTEGTLKKSECTSPGGTRSKTVNGQTYNLYQSCWAYRDTWVTQTADNGSCQTYVDNPACTLAAHQCAFYSEDGTCLHEYATYSCETRTSGKVMICGGDVFCLDGKCDRAQSEKNEDFGTAVSQLAALAAAGKDVAELNGVDVRAFTGQAKFCRKAFGGFSNCCKDGGWGQDAGLAKCNSEEKALGKAKEKKLTISIGEFCSKKKLGVCLQKKRSYCQFDSKLAQIVQQQGRNGQLHIGFGRAKHPDCRGVTVDELQRIHFDKLDFTNFYEDLMNNQNIPDAGALTDRVKDEIAGQLKQAGR
ncbi:type-F conjugative transfer system mating-pair stabilization protein TraN [Pectobacterium aroidearum]|uniref:type-F conjugative transfer system mating-pair stabilization protein TraN n=1 Tax=Pectobacterium aroidearum TaxID=1201031 RepID=UPI00301856A9